MYKNQMIVSPGPGNLVVDEYGNQIKPPIGWIFLPAGDAGLTRKVTSKGIYWRVQIKKGKRTISKGIWAPEQTISASKQEVDQTRNSEAYKKKMAYTKKRRDLKQSEYESDFLQATKKFLNFHPKYKGYENIMASCITKHAIPIGSGTVARTQMIPLEKRVSHAVIAWMRHKTTAYDNMHIPLIKGERRIVRKQLAQQSLLLLKKYQSGERILESCPLYRALNNEV